MKKNKVLVIGLILILILALCCIPNKSKNSKYKLEIISSYGDNEAYHPKVLSFPNGWNGYKYWMSYTPYPNGDDSKENPHIAVSNDMINWNPVKGTNGSLDDISNDGVKEQYNSDSHIVYNSDTKELECYWRFVDNINNTVTLYRRKTKDGIHWSPKEITAYSNNRKQKDYVSPAIIYQNGLYKMWYVNKNKEIKYATSINGTQWEDVASINLKYEKSLITWHLDVISTTKGYEMIVVAYDKWANHHNMNLYYTKSQDGIHWEIAKTIIEPTTKTKNWDNRGIYRSSFIYENGMYYVFYGGTSKNYHHGIGFVYGQDILKLHSVDTNFKDKKKVEELKNKLEI